jgi:RimJ/RimL family protein N-acetyltransferase
MNYTMSYREPIVLGDGARLELRAIEPADRTALAESFRRLSPQSRRQRFLASKSELTDRELHQLTECDGESDYAIAARLPCPGACTSEIVGVARFSRAGQDPSVAEIAVAVIDAWQRRGLGRALLERIVEAAAERGITQADGLALADNHQIRRLLESHAASVAQRHEDGLLRFSCALPSLENPDNLPGLYEFLRLAAQGAILAPLLLGWAPVLRLSPFRYWSSPQVVAEDSAA